MDKKKIMIDNVDVSECEHVRVSTSLFKEKTYVKCPAFFLENNDSYCDCTNNPNCYFKQLKRKEQKCEKLEKTLTEINDIAEILAPMTDEYENCYDRDRCFECEFTEDCQYFNIKQILQKINEVKINGTNP